MARLVKVVCFRPAKNLASTIRTGRTRGLVIGIEVSSSHEKSFDIVADVALLKWRE